jgi:hypothetical protein
MLVEDLILMRPPGLWTAIVVLATEFLRSRTALTRELNFVVEWLLVSGLMVGMLLAYRLVFGLPLPQAALRLCGGAGPVVDPCLSAGGRACRDWHSTCASPPPARSTTTGGACETHPRDSEDSAA